MSSFEKIVVNKKNVYKCKQCKTQVQSYAATKDHHCVFQQFVNNVLATPQTPLFSPAHMPSPFVQFPTVLGPPTVQQGAVHPQVQSGAGPTLQETPQSRYQPMNPGAHAGNEQPSWFVQQMLQQERIFRQEKMQKQEENHQIQIGNLQS